VSNAVRAAILVRAVKASVSGSSDEIADLYTPDVEGWSPNGTVSSAAELAVEFEDRDDAFSDVEIVVVALDVGGDRACVEWVASVVHIGPLMRDRDVAVPPTGHKLTLRGVTIAEFEDDRIRSFRQYWNELEWLEQLDLLAGGTRF
jgi:ketosteroid isomerase-like protein